MLQTDSSRASLPEIPAAPGSQFGLLGWNAHPNQRNYRGYRWGFSALHQPRYPQGLLQFPNVAPYRRLQQLDQPDRVQVDLSDLSCHWVLMVEPLGSQIWKEPYRRGERT